MAKHEGGSSAPDASVPWRRRPRKSLQEYGRAFVVVPAVLMSAWLAVIVSGVRWVRGTPLAGSLTVVALLVLALTVTVWVALFSRRPREPQQPLDSEQIDWSKPELPRF